MLGIVLLVISIILFFVKKWQYLSYFLYIGFLTDGYNIAIDRVLGGLKNVDLALIYSIVIMGVLVVTHTYKPIPLKTNKSFVWLCIFITASFIFSMAYYKIPFFDTLQGGRFLLLVLCYPILLNMPATSMQKLLHLLAWFTVWMAVVDVLQIILQHPILPTYTITKDNSLGLIRFYSFSPFTVFYLIVTILNPSFYGKYTKLVMALFVVCLLGTFARSLILFTGAAIVLALIFSGRKRLIIKYALLMGLVALPFLPMLSERFGGDTSSDIQNVLLGNIEFSSYEQQSNGNFTYRISWVLERVLYLVDRPWVEQFFGMGLLSDSSPISNRMYNFVVNIKFYDTGIVQQLKSPDIAYGTMLSYYGFGGMVVYFYFLWNVFREFYRSCHHHPYYVASAVWIVYIFLLSFFSDKLSMISIFCLCFVILAYRKKVDLQMMAESKV